MTVTFKENDYQGVYHLHLETNAHPTQSFSATPIVASHTRGAASAFVYLPNGQFTTDNALKFAGLPRPKLQYVGRDKHAVLKEIVVQGNRIVYYEYPSKCGHKCRLEIVQAPSSIGTHLFDPCSRGSSKKARVAAETALKEFVNQKLVGVQLQNQKVTSISSTDLTTTTSTDQQPPAADETPTPSDDQQSTTTAVSDDTHSEPTIQEAAEEQAAEINPDPDPNREFDHRSDGERRQEEIQEGLKDGLEGAHEVYEERVGGGQMGEELPSQTPAPKSVGYRPLASFKKLAQKIDVAAQEALRTGRAEGLQGGKQLKKALRLEKVADLLDQKLQDSGQKITLKTNDGQQKTVTRDQAKRLLAEARLKSQTSVIKGVDNVFRGVAKASVGHSVQSGTKRLGKEIKQGRVTGLNALGSNFGVASVDFIVQGDYSLKAVGENVIDASGQAVKGVAGQMAQNVAYSMAKGAVKELAPELAKKIPGVTAINAVYSVGKAVFTANTAEEALANGITAGVDTAISLGCAAAGQALIPVPFVGAFIGSFAGSAVIYGKNWVMSD